MDENTVVLSALGIEEMVADELRNRGEKDYTLSGVCPLNPNDFSSHALDEASLEWMESTLPI